MPLTIANLLKPEQIAHVPNGCLGSPFHERSSKINFSQSWQDWNGFLSANYYMDEHLEYFSTRNTCGLLDVSPMCKYRFKGPDAEAMLNRMVTRDVTKHPINSVQYNIWCTDAGRIVDDGTLFRLADDDFMLTCAEPGMDWFQLAAIGFNNVEITDMSPELAALAIQGPTSCALLKAMGFTGVENAKPFDIVKFPYLEGEIMISRTGFTGDLGYELWVDPKDAIALWDHIFSTGSIFGVQPLGLESLEKARLEAGFLSPYVDFHPALHTMDKGNDHSPFEMALSWIVNFKKGHFTGRAALLKEKQAGKHRRLLKLDIEGNKAAESAILYRDEACQKQIGYVTSAMWSPVVKANIALGLVEGKYADGPIYAEVYHQRELRWVRKVCKCTKQTKPFWAPARAKQTPPADT
ncbi:aminomethyltransferase family protein [Dasania marina]|uniref:aminomethyltransferase family protein n=1 Tax=Dasania marina TaxID=471499 RepID=UPI00037E6863|nr:aminomethyltransferase family protein [Dasania marina]